MAENKSNKSTVWGFAAGFALAAAVIVLDFVNQGRSENLQQVVNFFVSVPAWVLGRYHFSEWIFYISFFVWWTIWGAVIFGIASRRGAASLFGILLVLTLLLYTHRKVQLRLEHDIDSALQALFSQSPK